MQSGTCNANYGRVCSKTVRKKQKKSLNFGSKYLWNYNKFLNASKTKVSQKYFWRRFVLVLFNEGLREPRLFCMEKWTRRFSPYIWHGVRTFGRECTCRSMHAISIVHLAAHLNLHACRSNFEFEIPGFFNASISNVHAARATKILQTWQSNTKRAQFECTSVSFAKLLKINQSNVELAILDDVIGTTRFDGMGSQYEWLNPMWSLASLIPRVLEFVPQDNKLCHVRNNVKPPSVQQDAKLPPDQEPSLASLISAVREFVLQDSKLRHVRNDAKLPSNGPARRETAPASGTELSLPDPPSTWVCPAGH